MSLTDIIATTLKIDTDPDKESGLLRIPELFSFKGKVRNLIVVL